MIKKYKGMFITQTAEDLAELLGLEPSCAMDWRMRYDLNQRIVENFKRKKMSITTLALKSQTSRARITRILKKDTLGMSLDLLFRVLGATGEGVQLKFLKVS